MRPDHLLVTWSSTVVYYHTHRVHRCELVYPILLQSECRHLRGEESRVKFQLISNIISFLFFDLPRENSVHAEFDDIQHNIVGFPKVHLRDFPSPK